MATTYWVFAIASYASWIRGRVDIGFAASDLVAIRIRDISIVEEGMTLSRSSKTDQEGSQPSLSTTVRYAHLAPDWT